MIDVAFANDCDSLTWANYKYVHGMMNSLKLSAGDSFWLFSPDNSDMALFLNDTGSKASNHDNILGEIKEGRIDVLHGIGAYGKTPCYPSRDDVRRAFDYLDRHGCKIRVWSNHGNSNHVHNMAARGPRTYQQGDLPFSEHYVLDIVLEYGVEYFWLSHDLRFSLDEPFRVLREEMTPSGAVINTFTRFAPAWTTNAWTLPELLSAEALERACAARQSVVLFTHWGTRGKGVDTNAPLLPRESIAALARLAEMQNQGKVRVVRLLDLLCAERERTLEQEVERIAAYHLEHEHKGIDAYYKVQFEPDRAMYFSDLVERFGVRGQALLDAGGGTANLCFPATRNFETVVCMDTSVKALEAGKAIADGLQLDNVLFRAGSLEERHFPPETFDVVCARGVIHLVDHDVVLRLFHEVLKRGGTALVTVNGDGFYQHAICDKKMNVESYTRLLWNSLHRRMGGDAGMLQLLESASVLDAAFSGREQKLLDLVLDVIPVRMPGVLRRYQQNLKALLGVHIADNLFRVARQQGVTLDSACKGRADRAVLPPKNRWLCHYPEEFSDVARNAGFTLMTWRPQSAFARTRPGYSDEDEHHGLLRCWYALLTRGVN